MCPAIAPLVTDKDRLVRDAAIRALANNPSPSAGNRLRRRLRAAGETALQVALVNALGFRAEPESAELLAQELQSNNPDVAGAAARAPGTTGHARGGRRLEGRASSPRAVRSGARSATPWQVRREAVLPGEHGRGQVHRRAPVPA